MPVHVRSAEPVDAPSIATILGREVREGLPSEVTAEIEGSRPTRRPRRREAARTSAADLEARGLRSVIAGIALPNPASVRLFESLGFEPVAVFPRNGFKHGAWPDVGCWRLHIGDGPVSPVGSG
jgi:hypothetical protein